MTIKLNAEMQEIVDKNLGSGKFATPSDVVLAALRSLQRNHGLDYGAPPELRATSINELNAMVEEGDRSILDEETVDLDEAFAQLMK